MHATTKALLKAAALSDVSLSSDEKEALVQFADLGKVSTILVDGPLLLNARRSAEFLGVSEDTFSEMRKQARRRGVKELLGQEVTPQNYMFSRLAMLAFARGEFGLEWPGMLRGKLPMLNSESASAIEMRRVG